MTLVALRNVSRSFPVKTGKKTVLGGIDLEIAPGEIVGVIGHNGIGKSTLAAIVAGVDPGFEGEVERAPGLSRAPLILQDYRASLLPWLSILGNIEFPLALRGIPPRERRRRALEMLERAPPRLDLSTPVRKLSGGQSQLVAVLRALVSEPRLIVCDEPFSALDYGARSLLLDLLASHLHEASTAALFISHDVQDAQLLSDRLIVIGGAPASVRIEISSPPRSLRNRIWLESEQAARARKDIFGAIDASL